MADDDDEIRFGIGIGKLAYSEMDSFRRLHGGLSAAARPCLARSSFIIFGSNSNIS